MKRIIALFVAVAAFATMTYAQTVVSIERPSDKEYRKAVKTMLYKSNGHDITPKRMEAMEITQRMINTFLPADWRTYRNITDAAELAKAENEGVPYFISQAVNKVCREVKKTKVKQGTVAVWLLYNMGYIVKTPTSVFALDIHTKDVDKIADLVDFVMITHRHGDHCNGKFLRAMTARGKAVYAAFDIEGVNVTKVTHKGEFQVGDVHVRTTIGDHNKKLRKFVTAYEIDCGANTAHTVIYHTGDSNNYKQLNPQKQVDIFMPHMAVGLNIPKALDKIKPYHIFISHNQELGHGIRKWRWTFHDALKLKAKLNHDHIWIPCWGERVIYNRNNWK